MRHLILFIVISILLFSCGRSTTSEETETKQTTDSTQVELKKTIWNIPLTAFWNDDEHFILTIPNDYGLDLMASSTPHKTDDLVTDTLQGKILDRAVEPLLNNGCEPMRSLKVELGTTPKSGWVKAEDIYTIRSLNLASFNSGGATFKVGLMDPWYRRDADNNCVFAHLIFLYDDHYLYLIDAAGTDVDLHWEKAKHLSVVNSLDNIDLTGKQDGNTWVLTWGEPNAKKELRLAWTGDHVKYVSSNTTPQNDIDGLNSVGHEEAQSAEIKTVTCVLQDAGLGDCFHLEFDCGDFGSAQLALKGAEYDLWKDLTIDDNGNTAVNPKYAGKTFEITYKVIVGEGCGDPSSDHSHDEIQQVMKFKLIQLKQNAVNY